MCSGVKIWVPSLWLCFGHWLRAVFNLPLQPQGWCPNVRWKNHDKTRSEGGNSAELHLQLIGSFWTLGVYTHCMFFYTSDHWCRGGTGSDKRSECWPTDHHRAKCRNDSPMKEHCGCCCNPGGAHCFAWVARFTKRLCGADWTTLLPQHWLSQRTEVHLRGHSEGSHGYWGKHLFCSGSWTMQQIASAHVVRCSSQQSSCHVISVLTLVNRVHVSVSDIFSNNSHFVNCFKSPVFAWTQKMFCTTK